MRLRVVDFKMCDYREIWEVQKQIFNGLLALKKSKEKPVEEFMLIGEHSPVYTLGFHGNAANLLADEKRLAKMGAECIRIERGGDITYHGPGQMIAYPLIDLESHGIGIKGYMDMLEDCIMELLSDFDIYGEKIDNAIGIWIGKNTPEERKICAMGVKCTRFVTMHGLALNVNTDLSAFSAINPCGFVDKVVTSIARECVSPASMEEVKHRFVEIFSRKFGYSDLDLSSYSRSR